MTDAMRAFLSRLIDYAGLFPPAGLDMKTAFANWCEYESGDDAFMLNSFICPAWRTDELVPLLRGRRERFPLTLIIRPGPNLAADIGNAMDIGGRSEAVEVVGVEGKLESIDAAAARDVFSRLRERGVGGAVWFETGFPEGWERDLPGFLGDLPEGCGLKVRCGGLAPEAFPSVGEIAGAIVAARDAKRPLKATAGLHHPVRHHDAALDVMMHGFLNVFGAAILAAEHGLDVEATGRILAETDPGRFRFDGGYLQWGDLGLSDFEIGAAREGFATSFGSCSFDEPREDLRALGLM